MFGNWRVPKELLDLEPITRETCGIFYGRENEITKLKKFVSDSNVVLIEGEAGVGKTSLGNYVRFTADESLTPLSEIKCQPTWQNFNFLIELQSHIIGEIFREGSRFHGLQHNEIVKTIYNRNKTQEFRSINASFGIIGGGFSTSISQQAVISEASLFEELRELVSIVKNNTELPNPIIVQVNNLDLDAVFNEEELSKFLNCIRDALQIKGINFILIGTEGIFALIKSKVKRLQQILSTTITIDSFSLDELLNVLNKRMANSKYSGNKLPLDRDLMELIYNHSSGSTREVMNEIRELLLAFQNEPLMESITVKDASDYYAKESVRMLQKVINNNKNIADIIKIIKQSPGITQKEIVEKVSIKQGTVSGIVNKLIDSDVLIRSILGTATMYRVRTKYELALNSINLDSFF